MDVRNRFGKKPMDLLSNIDMRRMLRQFVSRRASASSGSKNGRCTSKHNSLSRERKSYGGGINVQIYKISEENSASSMTGLFRRFSKP